MKFLHLMVGQSFNIEYIKFIEKNFNIEEHIFVFTAGLSDKKLDLLKRTYIYKIEKNIYMFRNLIRLIIDMNNAKKIYLHGLFNPYINCILYVQPWLLKKCNWIVWGGDLYLYREDKKNLKSKIYEIIRKKIIRNFGDVSTLVKGDYELAEKYYKIKGKYNEAVYIQDMQFNELNIPKDDKHKKEYFIQVGNSATISNNHIDMLYKLSKYKNCNIKIFCPLSYGDLVYREKVINIGTEIFGKKFVPLKDFMNYKEYVNYLNTIDIAIFNNDRQQALGNIYCLIYLGKKIYIREDTTMWNHFKERLNVKMYSIKNIENLDFNDFIDYSNDIAYSNKHNISKFLNENNYIEIWDENFNN